MSEWHSNVYGRIWQREADGWEAFVCLQISGRGYYVQVRQAGGEIVDYFLQHSWDHPDAESAKAKADEMLVSVPAALANNG